jgi:hypothetical protein
MTLIRKTVTKVVNGETKTYVNVILVTADGIKIPIKAAFQNDARLLRSLAKDE